MLVVEQARVADSLIRFKTELLKLAEQSRAADPARTELLEKVAQQISTKDGAEVNLQSILKLLESQLLRDVDQAVGKQERVQAELTALLNMLLSENRDRRNASEKDRLRARIKEIEQAIRVERGIQGQTERSGELPDLSRRQGELADKTKEIAKKLKEAEDAHKAAAEAPSGDKSGSENDKPAPDKSTPDKADGKRKPQDTPPSDAKPGMGDTAPPEAKPQEEEANGRKQLEQAVERMKQAQKRLDEAKRNDAAKEQDAAIAALEKAKAELEEILRQKREEEIEKSLAMLEARFRNMLKLQQAVREGTVQLDRKPQAQRDRTDEIEAGRLARREQQIVSEVDKASLLLREDGTAVAFPVVVEQLREDMELIAERLGQAKVGSATQRLEQDVMDALQEMITALEKAQKDLKAKRGMSQPGQPSDPPLVDAISELKMIRALQVRVNRRTTQYDEMIRSGETTGEAMLPRLRKLAEHEEKIHRISRDLQTGKNE